MRFTLTWLDWIVGVAYADIIQSMIKIFGCALMLAIGLYKVGGWHELMLKVPEAMRTDPICPLWGVILGAIYGGTFYWASIRSTYNGFWARPT